ncbi:MAG: hydroxyisourate hydrolase [Acidobacteriota bacterium]
MRSPLTTHILDTARGAPASGVQVSLFAGTEEIGAGTTDADGRIGELLPAGSTLAPGVYRLHFRVEDYWRRRGESGFFPSVDVTFRVEDGAQHYHVPLLLSPYGFSTYRGS